MDQQWCVEAKKYPLVSPPNKAAAKGSLKSYFRLQLLQKFIRCVCQVLMKLLMIEAGIEHRFVFSSWSPVNASSLMIQILLHSQDEIEHRIKIQGYLFDCPPPRMFSTEKKKANKPTIPAFTWKSSYERPSGSLAFFHFGTEQGTMQWHTQSECFSVKANRN